MTEQKSMRVDRDLNGDFIVDPVELATRFNMTPSDFRARMQQGLVVSTIEVGEDADQGSSRLTVRFGNRLWLAIVDAKGLVIRENMVFVRGSKSRRDKP